MTEKLKFKDAKQSFFRSYHALRFSAMFLGLALIVQLITLPDLLAQVTAKHKVTGKVITTSDNSVVPGANIIIKGTTLGTVTDVNGNFSMDVSENDVLIISYIGYVTKEIPVAGTTSIEVKLVEEIAKLDDVVVIGYGIKKRKDVTGSISSVTSDDIMKSQPVTIEQAFQGKIAGVVVQQISGKPGGGVSVQIRGLTSFGTSNPLYVLDGIQMDVSGASEGINPLAALNPSEIESIDVLKDASATAIYGAKGTDGVIIITTKRGKMSAPKISYTFETGFQQIPKKVDVMDLQEYATFTNERSTGIGWSWDARPVFANPKYLGKGTDWQNALFRNAPKMEHTISVSGGDARTTYFLSGSYYKQEGIARGSEFDRISVRLNLDNKTTNWLKIGTNLQLASMYENLNGNNGVIQEALNQTPDVPVKNSDGTWGGRYNPNGWINNTANPVAMASINKNDLNRKEIYGTLYAEVTFAKGLMLRNEASGVFKLSNQSTFNPNYKTGLVENLNNSGSYNSSTGVNTSLSNYLTYNHLFANKYNLAATLGHEAILDKGEGVSGYRSHYASNNVQVIDQGDPTTAKNGGSKSQSSREAYFGRLDLGINDKYLLTGTIREDGDSKYFVDNRWILSYSGALGWKLSNEPFLKNISVINDLKLRIGYGLTNKNAGRSYAYASTFNTVATGLTGIAQELKNIGNPGLKWEQTKNANIGLDGSLLNSRISFSVDLYDKKTDNLAMQTSLPMYSGTAIGWSPGALDAPWINVGSMENKGFDFSLHTTNIKREDFTWRTDLTVSRNFNNVLKLNADGAPIIGGKSKTVVGRSLGEFYGYEVEGVYANPVDFLGDEANGIKPVARPVDSNGNMYPVGTANGSIWYGDIKFKDLNGDGVIDSKDQTFLGSPIPKVQLGFNNSFTYKNFDLNIFFTANYGNKVFNNMRVDGENTRNSVGNLKVIMNYAKLGLIDPEGSATDVNNVYVTNPGTKIQGLRNDDTNGNNRISDRYVEDGSFIRCKNISLGYNIPQSLIQRLHINSLRVYANVSNVFLITRYKGLDPEIGSWDPINAGVDGGYYPQPRVFTFGLNVSLN
jgi:TonB-dependent starch-binding outer membrane protein SusC